MIRLGRQLILTVCIVNFGTAYHVQHENQRINQAVSNRANEDSGVQNDFQNLLDSISKNDGLTSGIHRTILKQEIVRERAAFSLMKDDLKNAHSANTYKKRNPSGRSKIVAIKREIGNDTCSSGFTSNINASLNYANQTEEDKFNSIFDRDPIWDYGWELMGKSFRDKGETPLKKFCEEAHFRAGNGMTVVVSAHMNARKLRFRDGKYHPMKIDVVTYEIKDYGNFFDTDTTWNTFYITQGLRPDCVYFLNRIVGSNETEFYLGQHVCGVKLHG